MPSQDGRPDRVPLHNEPASYWYVARLSVEGAEP